MYKYTGDSILSASFTVQVPKPLDNRTVVNNLQELYSIPAAYAYLGMTVANIDNGNIYMLVDKSKIYEKAGWRASYESIQIIACTYDEYQEWKLNTTEDFQPIDESKTYIHQDTYYYIYEDSLPGGEENQEYVRRSDWSDLLNVVSGKASSDGLARTNAMVADIIENYVSKTFAIEFYAPLTMFDLSNEESFIKTNFFTKTETLEKFVKFSDLKGEGMEDDDYVFVTAARYQQDQEALETYKQGVADELSQCLKVGENGELDSITVSKIKSKKIDDKQLEVDVTPNGLFIGGDQLAKVSQIPPHITLTRAEYDALVENDQIDEDTYYHITGDEDTYVLQSDLDTYYYTKTGVESYIAGRYYTKLQVNHIIEQLSYYTRELIDGNYVSNNSLQTTLADYVTIAMLGGDGDTTGPFIFVKQSDYNTDLANRIQLREQDLQDIDDTYVKKRSDAELNSLETSTVKNGSSSLTIADIIAFNNKKLAYDEDVPVIQVVTAEEYEELLKDPNVYYFVYNTNDDLAFVTAEELNNYYTKAQIDSKLIGLSRGLPPENGIVTEELLEETLEDYLTKSDAELIYVPRVMLASLFTRLDQLENLVREYLAVPTEAFAILPLSADIPTSVRPYLAEPVEVPIGYTPDVTKPTIQSLVYPVEWEDSGKPEIRDSNGFEVGYSLRGTTTIQGVDYYIYDILLGVDNYTITFH